MSIVSVEALQLSQLLGSLLASVVDAQAQSARATVDFVESIGFEPTPDGERMRLVKLHYTKKDADGERAEFEVEVPLLALVNVPSLAVKQAKLTFSYDVVSAATTAPTATTTAVQPRAATAGGLASLVVLPVAKLTGFLRPPSSSSPTPVPLRRTAAVYLEVTLEQQEVPLGIERLFDLAELGISERPAAGTP